MQFTETSIKGALIIDLEERADRRGFFARTFCANEFEVQGLNPRAVQCNLSFNHKKGTLRGLHYQIAPATDNKVIRCIQGAIYDVIVDLRPESPTYLCHIGLELTATNRRALYIPEMVANGYQALTDGAEVMFQVGQFYTPECERGVRYDDPRLGIKWPIDVTEISEKDTAWQFVTGFSEP
ncbi:dTDP-4-dehydrorhamnose 3,5-epimerase [Tychonema sp. LEGE 07199]|uniref:dTDP-4-dehydrorhamnose 3,5-epimerase n=1 Tax=Microcoleaceae TaxID=1892252 RepID=UPI0018830AC8|nr:MULTISPECIES: dTDP-4-dehydrorhamnose 3,5-epimerase [unclassified Tychonema]MBE9120476.1 dTDP-4-dehydrorhamnose 3,5-epimerase [Tychonema sp. LEGE 07199]MBE9133185.1 dTDP-4-dehydrorhamnose 3,5-epimerase [Tychonema sp. LEGE 07196]